MLSEPKLMVAAAVVFDADGVLVDSLPAHLAICRDKSREYLLSLSIPSIDEFREWVRRGVIISPMKEFFLAVGFPPPFAEQADQDYQNEFAHNYPSPVFPGVERMLSRLSAANVGLGLVTSNTFGNVESALGGLMSYFGDAVFTRDRPAGMSKAVALQRLVGMLRLRPDQVFYVGDQPADAAAASEAGVHFLGVTYGWGIAQGDGGAQTVDKPAEVADHVLRSIAAGTDLRP